MTFALFDLIDASDVIVLDGIVVDELGYLQESSVIRLTAGEEDYHFQNQEVALEHGACLVVYNDDGEQFTANMQFIVQRKLEVEDLVG